MPVLRRFLSLCALLFWQGGFLFYGLVAIPIGLQVLSEQVHLQARITASATSWLNWIGGTALGLLLWDLIASDDPSRGRRTGRAVSWALMFVTLAALFGLHHWLHLLHPPQDKGPKDVATFQFVHCLYIGASAAQWLTGLAYLWLTVGAWRAEDTKRALDAGDAWRTPRTKTPGAQEIREGREGLEKRGG